MGILGTEGRRISKDTLRSSSLMRGSCYYVGPKKEEKEGGGDRGREEEADFPRLPLQRHRSSPRPERKTVHRIQSKYYWLGIIKDVVDWIKVCDTCQHTERSKNLARTVRPIKVDAPWEIVGIDIIGPFPETQQGNSNVIVLIDYFSKWPEAFPVQRTDALSVAKCISKCIYRFGAPKTIVCTQNADFCDEVSERLSDRWSIVQAVSPLDPPQLNPLHDGSFSQLKEAVEQMVAEKQSQWDDFLDPVLFLFRTSSNPTTKFSPYSLMFSRKPDLPDQTTLSLLSYDDQEQDEFSTTEKASSFLSAMQEQQNSVKQLVLANMTAAYKQEKKKNAKRRTHRSPSVTFKLSEPQYAAGDSPSPKKLKDSLYLSFPVEQISSEDMKTETLAFHLA
ncbi:uncharacterized protein zgc:113436 isoform X2 [Gymnodraco acuticeps]|uniref:Gypsy retrotransposon integrase-like protein 1 n=1 Tax=Gymnodraco acuticeps TaxID=8218 RepID=A0A6P8T552_GYMAC|nr:uncharacterized protein zgc:113436 isoform X2 [Gymnodraco acuticeps]